METLLRQSICTRARECMETTMAGHHPFRDLFKDWSAARLARVNEKKRRLLYEPVEGDPRPTSPSDSEE